MKLFFSKLVASGQADNATVQILKGLIEIRRQGGISTDHLNMLVKDASSAISASWPEGQH